MRKLIITDNRKEQDRVSSRVLEINHTLKDGIKSAKLKSFLRYNI